MPERLADVMTDWMRVTRTCGVVLARNLLPARWGVALDAVAGSAFHYVQRGRACLRVGQTTILLAAGDLAIVCPGTPHVIGDSARARPRVLRDLSPTRPFPGPICTTLICGEYRSDIPHERSVLHALPPILHLRAAEIEAHPSLLAVLELVSDELSQNRPGSEPLIRHLLDALFVYVLRAHATTRECATGWLAALDDPELTRALAAMHDRPAHGWTVASLARVARLSRAAFARRFAETLAEPPLAYLTRLRMMVAIRMLQARMSVGEVARQVGYRSEFAFSRAFKRQHGRPPSTYRRNAVDDTTGSSQASGPMRSRTG